MAQLVHPLRVALTGKGIGFGLFDTLAILGAKRVSAESTERRHDSDSPVELLTSMFSIRFTLVQNKSLRDTHANTLVSIFGAGVCDNIHRGCQRLCPTNRVR